MQSKHIYFILMLVTGGIFGILLSLTFQTGTLETKVAFFKSTCATHGSHCQWKFEQLGLRPHEIKPWLP